MGFRRGRLGFFYRWIYTYILRNMSQNATHKNLWDLTRSAPKSSSGTFTHQIYVATLNMRVDYMHTSVKRSSLNNQPLLELADIVVMYSKAVSLSYY